MAAEPENLRADIPLTQLAFEQYWQAATNPFPVLIVGMGRWGRVWAEVIATSRGSSASIACVARSNFSETHRWRVSQPRLLEATLCGSLEQGLDWLLNMTGHEGATARGMAAAWITSRPSQHESDVLACLPHVGMVYAEKPLTGDEKCSLRLLDACAGSETGLALGTEFALQPVFHVLARQLNRDAEPVKRIRLYWNSTRGAARYGTVPRQHSEISLLQDVWPHACSILTLFCPLAQLSNVSADSTSSGDEWNVAFEAGDGVRVEVLISRSSAERRRELAVDAGERTQARINFSTSPGLLRINGEDLPVDSGLAQFDSTLRLALGDIAFAMKAPATLSPRLGKNLHRMHEVLQHILECRPG